MSDGLEGPLIQIDRTLDGGQYVNISNIREENIPQAKVALRRQSAYIIEDETTIHGTTDDARTKDFLSLTNLELSPYALDLNIVGNA